MLKTDSRSNDNDNSGWYWWYVFCKLFYYVRGYDGVSHTGPVKV